MSNDCSICNQAGTKYCRTECPLAGEFWIPKASLKQAQEAHKRDLSLAKQDIETWKMKHQIAQERIEEFKRIHEAQAHAINTITSCLGLKEWGLNEAINTILQLQKVEKQAKSVKSEVVD